MQVLNSCENFVVAPSFWNALEVSKRMAMQELFCRSIGRDLEGFEASDCTLLQPSRCITGDNTVNAKSKTRFRASIPKSARPD